MEEKIQMYSQSLNNGPKKVFIKGRKQELTQKWVASAWPKREDLFLKTKENNISLGLVYNMLRVKSMWAKWLQFGKLTVFDTFPQTNICNTLKSFELVPNGLGNFSITIKWSSADLKEIVSNAKVLKNFRITAHFSR